ncbi:MAG: hypothetical protein NVS3B7_11430 [Candidatus Elarobacter sp.]
MNRQALVGIFTIVSLIGLFAIFFVLANVGTQGRYRVGIHFKSAAGLHKGALVYESGVVVGIVDQTKLLEDFTVDVILAINNSVSVPRNARFLIQAPLTGDSSLEIVPAVPPPQPAGYAAPTTAPAAVAVLPREVLPIAEQPQGTNPATIQDLLDQGQGEVHKLDAMLVELQRREPQLLNTFQSALNNANAISATANKSLTTLSRRVDGLTTTLELAINQNSATISDLTSTLDNSVKRNTGHFDAIVASLDNSARDLNQTADHVASLAADPQLRSNVLETTQGIAKTATTFASIASDLRQVTGNPQTQAQLRDTVANVDAASQKANSLLAQFGGTSSVYGVDRGATPAPGASPRPDGTFPQTGAPRANGSPPPGTIQANVKNKLGSLVKNLVALQVRVSELDKQKANTNSSPLLTKDRGPSTDINVVALPKGATSLFAGVNDIGGPASSWNFAGMATVRPGLQIGGGVLYSRLGARAVYSPGLSRALGLEARVYDLRRLTTDAYANVNLGNGLTLFGGERDALRKGRRTTFGLQYQF